MTETPFTISVSDEKLNLLRSKLELTTFPDELEDADWKYGVPLADIKRLVERWKNGYDWRKHEKELNSELPMFTTMCTKRAPQRTRSPYSFAMVVCIIC